MLYANSNVSWIWNALVGWFFDLIAQVFDLITDEFFGFFNLHTEQFFAVFSPIANLFTLFVWFSFGLVILLGGYRLFRNTLGMVDDDMESPSKVLIRVAIAFILVAFSQDIINIESSIISALYNQTKIIMDVPLNFSWEQTKETMMEAYEYDESDSTEQEFDITGQNAERPDTYSGVMSDEAYAKANRNIVISIVIIGCLVAIFFNYFKLLLEAAERYVVICIAYLCAPMAFATYATKSTERIYRAYIKLFFNQLLLMCFNLIFVYGAMYAMANFKPSVDITTTGQTPIGGAYIPVEMTTSSGNTFTMVILILAFLIAGQKMDLYMKGLGLDVVQTGSIFDEIRGGIRSMATSIRGAAQLSHYAKSGRGGSAKGAGPSGAEGASLNKNATGGAGYSPAQAALAQGRLNMARRTHGEGDARTAQLAASTLKATKAGISGKNVQDNVASVLGNKAMKNLDKSSIKTTGGGISFADKNGAKGEISFGNAMKGQTGWTPITDSDGKKLTDKQGNPLGYIKNQDDNKLLGMGGLERGDVVTPGGSTPINQAMLEAAGLGTCSNGSLEYLGNGAFDVRDDNGQSLGTLISNASMGPGSGTFKSEESAVFDSLGNSYNFIPHAEAFSEGKPLDITGDVGEGLTELRGGIFVPTSDVISGISTETKNANNIATDAVLVGLHQTESGSFMAEYQGGGYVEVSQNDIIGKIGSGEMNASSDMYIKTENGYASVTDILDNAYENAGDLGVITDASMSNSGDLSVMFGDEMITLSQADISDIVNSEGFECSDRNIFVGVKDFLGQEGYNEYIEAVGQVPISYTHGDDNTYQIKHEDSIADGVLYDSATHRSDAGIVHTEYGNLTVGVEMATGGGGHQKKGGKYTVFGVGE